MAETLTNTTNEKGDNNDNLVSSVKKAAAILVAALGLTVATSQDVNAQMFSRGSAQKEIAKIDKQNEQKRNTIAEKTENLTEWKETEANQEKIIAGLRADLGKDNKNPSKSNRSSFAYNSTKPKDNSKIGRGLNN